MGKPFTKGDPRINRKGRGKNKLSIPDILRRIGNKTLPADLRKKLEASLVLPVSKRSASITRLEALMEAVYWCALKGESWAVQFVAERTEGKVKDVLAIEPTDQTVEEARKILARS